MDVPKFKVGDKVRFLIDKDDYYPMWDHLISDSIDNMVWTEGKVWHVSDLLIQTRHKRPDGLGDLVWTWPNIINPDYREDQWEREGWIRHVRAPEKPVEQCTCDRAAMLLNGCTCGVAEREKASKPKHTYKRSYYL